MEDRAVAAARVRRLLEGRFPHVKDPLDVLSALSPQWYRAASNPRDPDPAELFRITDLFSAGDLLFVSLELLDAAPEFGPEGTLSPPEVVVAWTVAWGPAIADPACITESLESAYGQGAPEPEADSRRFHPILGWWGTGLWRVGYRARIEDLTTVRQVQRAVEATRLQARRVASLAFLASDRGTP